MAFIPILFEWMFYLLEHQEFSLNCPLGHLPRVVQMGFRPFQQRRRRHVPQVLGRRHRVVWLAALAEEAHAQGPAPRHVRHGGFKVVRQQIRRKGVPSSERIRLPVSGASLRRAPRSL